MIEIVLFWSWLLKGPHLFEAVVMILLILFVPPLKLHDPVMAL